MAEDTDPLAHAVYWNGVACTWIPKVGCTTIRHSFAVAAGLLSETCGYDAVAPAALDLRPAAEEMMSARYRFIVLRHPVKRLASCFLDRVVTGGLRKFDFDPETCTIADFVDWAAEEGRVNHHTRPQTSFVGFCYDGWFRIEDPQWTKAVEEKSGMRIIRRCWPHHLGTFQRIRGDFTTATVADLRRMRSRGRLPTIGGVVSPTIADRICEIYADDRRLYSSLT